MSIVPWYENDTYWASVYNFFFSEKAFAQAELNVPKLIQLTGRRSGKVLDLGCGPGRYAVPLAKHGFKVTGVDRTQLLLDRGQEYASAQGGDVEWILADMRRFVRPNTYDLIVNMFTSFGYFEDMNENRAVLHNVLESLVPGGIFLIEMAGKEIVAKKLQATGSEVLPNGDLFIERRQVLDGWEKVETQIITIIQGQIRIFAVRLWIFSARELKGLLSESGFKNVNVYGSLDGVPYGSDAARLVVVAEK